MRGSAISGTSAGPMPVNRMARLKAVICLEPGTRSCGHCDRGNITFLFILNQDLADLPSIVRYRRPPCTVSARGKHFPTFPCPLPSSPPQIISILLQGKPIGRDAAIADGRCHR